MTHQPFGLHIPVNPRRAWTATLKLRSRELFCLPPRSNNIFHSVGHTTKCSPARRSHHCLSVVRRRPRRRRMANGPSSTRPQANPPRVMASLTAGKEGLRGRERAGAVLRRSGSRGSRAMIVQSGGIQVVGWARLSPMHAVDTVLFSVRKELLTRCCVTHLPLSGVHVGYAVLRHPVVEISSSTGDVNFTWNPWQHVVDTQCALVQCCPWTTTSRLCH